MTTVTLSPALLERVAKVAREQGTTAEALIEELLGPPVVVDEVEAVKEALEAVAQGKVRPFEDWLTEHNDRYPNPRDVK